MLLSLLFVPLSLIGSASAVVARSIVGTWSSKSMAVVTGPDFFNPLTDSLLEPNHTGVSYSFTSDSHYEMALYTITPNPTTPTCPVGVLRWAHGSYTLPADGSIHMTPIAVDGRQVVSAPCSGETSSYTRVSSNETMQSYTIELDSYRAQWKLTLNKLYGIPVQPLYLIYDPPQMLPTTTLLPTSSASAKSKRSIPDSKKRGQFTVRDLVDYVWYSSVAMLGVGSLVYVCV